MKILLKLSLFLTIFSNLSSCPTKLAQDLLVHENISFKDVNKSMASS